MTKKISDKELALLIKETITEQTVLNEELTPTSWVVKGKDGKWKPKNSRKVYTALKQALEAANMKYQQRWWKQQDPATGAPMARNHPIRLAFRAYWKAVKMRRAGDDNAAKEAAAAKKKAAAEKAAAEKAAKLSPLVGGSSNPAAALQTGLQDIRINLKKLGGTREEKLKLNQLLQSAEKVLQGIMFRQSGKQPSEK